MPKSRVLDCDKIRYIAFQKAKNKGTDQSALMRRLICAFVVRKPQKQVFSRRGPMVNVYVALAVFFFKRVLPVLHRLFTFTQMLILFAFRFIFSETFIDNFIYPAKHTIFLYFGNKHPSNNEVDIIFEH